MKMKKENCEEENNTSGSESETAESTETEETDENDESEGNVSNEDDCVEDDCEDTTSTSAAEIRFQKFSAQDFAKLKRGHWVVVQYKNLCYPGVIIRRDGLRLKPNCMAPSGKTGHWIWPDKKDNKTWIPLERVHCKLPTPCIDEDGSYYFPGWP